MELQASLKFLFQIPFTFHIERSTLKVQEMREDER